MEKLELKHVACYLPYGLTGLLNENNDDCFIIGASEDYIYTDSSFDELYYTDIKPILRPIKDLYIPETDCGIKIVHYFNFKTNAKLDCRNFPYHVMEQLFKHHFDIFGLIEKGLAIDINTLNEK